MPQAKKGLVMTTSNGVNLFFNEETSKFSASDRDQVVQSLNSDMSNVEVDPEAALMAFNLSQAISVLGWE
jgi:hypothetical protein